MKEHIKKCILFVICFFCISFAFFACKKASFDKKNNGEILIEDVIKLPKNFKKTYLLREVKIYTNQIDKSRKLAHIKICFLNFKNKKEIINNMKQAIIDIYKTRNAPYAIEIFSYKFDDDINEQCTLGSASFKAKDNKQNLLEYTLKIDMV